MKNNLRLAFVLIFGLCLVAACNPIEDKSAADGVAKNYFESIIARDFSKALTFYGPQFFQKTSSDEWLTSLKNINSKLGDLQKYEQVGWRVNASAGTAAGGTTFALQYRTTYSKYSAEEMLTLFRPMGGGEIKIIGHNINSPGFLK